MRDSGKTLDSRRAWRASRRGRSGGAELTGQSVFWLRRSESSSWSVGSSGISVRRGSSSRTGLVWSSVWRRVWSSRAGVCKSCRDCWIWGEIVVVWRRLGWRDRDIARIRDWALSGKRQNVLWPK